ncbi:hypothetical protein BJ138DRAFT_1111944 [Hygrophoropsis aurantiaca]|uniref:Uncharacterized protein n=1 Tax=Hygrophoropsis aurantiaca TaxID=72124 RepID=A0ACB8AHD6_9AGAM|nr:hypothetical protein BJ138DRAFT_1111944 [Hygrophoropsis aurantiaca]
MAQTLAQMSLTCAWLEAVLLGINCMLFGGCIFVLTSIRGPSYRVLIFASAFQFTLAATHAALTFVQALEAFTDPIITSQPDGTNNYYFNSGGNGLNLAILSIYVVNTYAQELLLLWRLFVVCNHRITLCILPLSLWITHCVVGSMAVYQFTAKDANALKSNVVTFCLSGWGLEMTVNVTTSASIAYRLWRTGRRNADILGQFTQKLKAAIFMIIECGALITTCTFVMFVLWAGGNPAGLIAASIAAQIATITPLLIIVRVGLDTTADKINARYSTSRPLEINVIRSQSSFRDYPMHIIPPNSETDADSSIAKAEGGHKSISVL